MTVSYVLDASFVLAFLLPSEHNSHVDTIFEQYTRQKIALKSNFLLPFEVINGLRSAVIRKRLPIKTAASLVRAFIDLSITLIETNELATFRFAIKNKLSFYDASYVYLAKSEKLRLLTFDKELLAVAH